MKLDLHYIEQFDTNLCWAAVAQMVSCYYKIDKYSSDLEERKKLQRYIAESVVADTLKHFNLNSCNPSSKEYNFPWSCRDIFYIKKINFLFIEDPINLKLIQAELKELRPIPIFLSSTTKIAHIVLIVGCESDRILLYDPNERIGPVWIDYNKLLSNYFGYIWTATYVCVTKI